MAYLWLVSFLWAFSFGIIKDTLSGLDAFFIALVRLGLASLAFLPFLLRGAGACPRRMKGQLAGIGALQFGVMYAAYFASFRFLAAYEVALFTVFTPLYVTLFADGLERRWRGRYWLAAGLAVGGALIAAYSRDKLVEDFWLGFGLVQVSNLAFALGQVGYRAVLNRSAVPLRDQEVIGWLYLGGAGLVGLASLFLTAWGTPATLPQPRQWLALLYLGVVASGLGFFLWNRGARLVNSGVLAVFNNLKAPLAVAVSLVVFGERADLPPLLLGGGVLLLALWLARKWE